MAKLRSRMLSPPLGPYFVERGIILNGGSFDATEELIRKHRKSNGYPPGDPRHELEQFTCERAPNLCDFASTEKRGVTVRSVLQKAGDFLHIYDKWVKAGGQTVDSVEANRRASICVNCAANKQVDEKVKVAGCCGGKWKSKLMDMATNVAAAMTWPMVRNKTTENDAKLLTCAPCGCPLRVKVWAPLEILEYDDEVHEEMSMLSGGKCWNQ